MTTHYEMILRPANSTDNPRNGEGAVIELTDGTLFLGYSEFYTTDRNDDAPARVCAMTSADRGRTWGERYVLVENEAQCTFSVSLIRVQSGEILLAYGTRPSKQGDFRLWMRSSTDEARTWSERWSATPEPGDYVTNNDRFVLHSSGRVLQPSCIIPNPWVGEDPFHCESRFYTSDDDGRTWKRSRMTLDLDANAGFQEPGVVELRDGSLMMWGRTSLGHPYRSWSKDLGETWSELEPIEDLVTPLSPTCIKRIPETGDLLAIFNQTFCDDPDDRCFSSRGIRTPLTSAISKDEGKSWGMFRHLETDPEHSYDYTSITFLGGEVLLTYHDTEWFSEEITDWGRSLKLRIVPVGWLYGEPGNMQPQNTQNHTEGGKTGH